MTSADRTDWFRKARFGMFIHWGLYSLLGRGEWAFNRERWSWEDYELLANKFTAAEFDPSAWAQLARDAGMKYMVLTTKHHEGFCLWDSPTCKFNAANSAARRNLLAEYVQAVREAGLKVGLYYSLGDWYNPDWAAGWGGDGAAAQRFMDYTHTLVRELMTGYGQIDILWYDLPQCYTPAQWRSVELNAMVRSLQPQILINNRAMTPEDFGTPEQHVAAAGKERLWETCMTLNETWGYCPSDTNYKSPRDVVLTLANCAAGGGNLLLNVGPDGRGRIPEESQRILRRVGQWLDVHGEAIYSTQRHDLMWYMFGPVTMASNNLYLHLKRYHGNDFILGGLTNRVLSASLLTTGQPLRFQQNGPQVWFHDLPDDSPDELISVIKLELDSPPDHDISRIIGRADVFPDLP